MNDKPHDLGFWPRFIVKFNDDIEIAYVDHAEESLKGPDRKKWDELAARFPGIMLNRLYTVVDAAEIRALVERAKKSDPDYHPPNLLTYFIVDAIEGFAPDTMARAFMEWSAVQTAYPDSEGVDPDVTPDDENHFTEQHYLDPAPVGIDAEYVWPRAGGLGYKGADGAGVHFIDMEQGWTLTHEDLIEHGAARLHGDNKLASQSHGTRVLGVICAVDNGLGCIGIAPGVQSVNVVSHFGSTMADAILKAIDSLRFGDVLLLEASINPEGGTDFLPIEIEDDRFDTIRLATALGITVIEAAANGSRSLDGYVNPSGQQVLNPGSADFRDSGAIIVGSSFSTVPHARFTDSNYGSRVDCYAWGERVVTTDSDNTDPGSTTNYSFHFKRTSAASAIIAGAAIVIQGAALANLTYRFSPRQLRAILGDTLTGTPSASSTDLIGVMPDLRAIMGGLVLNLAPDVYMRDYVGDTGDPHLAAISASPDIILRPVPEMSPQAVFGEGSGTENDALLGSQAFADQDNHVYVRARNRGGVDALNVTAEIYWAPVSTLLTPDLWTPLGSTLFSNLPSGDLLTVAPSITWASADIPMEGHYCFIGLLGNDKDPAPLKADFENWDNFRRFIRENNNVCWRNFNVVGNEPVMDIKPAFVGLPFLAPGAPDKARRMRLKVVARLPRGARISLNLPAQMKTAVDHHALMDKCDHGSDRLQIRVNPHGEYVLREFLFPAKSRAEGKLLVYIPEKERKNSYEVHVQQFYKKEMLGQVTWRLVPGLSSPGKSPLNQKS